MENKIKMTQKEFNEFYEIDKAEITGETEKEGTTHEQPISIKQDTTPDTVLSPEEEAMDQALAESIGWDEDGDK